MEQRNTSFIYKNENDISRSVNGGEERPIITYRPIPKVNIAKFQLH